MITITIRPIAKPVYNVSIYEYIPKEIAQSALDLIFSNDIEVEIAEYDPLIVWHVAVLTEETKFHYGVKSNAERILEKTETIGLSATIEEEETKSKEGLLVLSISLSILIIITVIIIKSLDIKIRE